jgi:hypothetical protein
VGCNVNRGYLCVGPWAVRELWLVRGGGYIGSSVAYLVVEGSENREYWT